MSSDPITDRAWITDRVTIADCAAVADRMGAGRPVEPWFSVAVAHRP